MGEFGFSMRRWKTGCALIAAILALSLLAGCASTEGLKKVPQGVRPESMNMDEIEPQFPSDTSIENQMMSLAAEIRSAGTMEEQKEKYDEFLHDAYIYIVGPYNYTAYLAADGRSISTYYDALIGHMSKFLGEWEPAAYMAIEEATWGAQLRAQYETRMCTPESIRNTYPVSDETGQSMVQETYDARDAYAEVISGEGSAVEEGLDLEAALDDLFTSRETLAEYMGYDSYLDFVVERRDRMPYSLESLQTLSSLVLENLVPAVQAASAPAPEALSPEAWQEALLALSARFPAYEEDLRYVVSNGVYAVEAAEEGTSRHFAYSLYQYDVSAGKAVLAGQADDALHVLKGLGLCARDMALPEEEWSISALTLYDQVQESAFAGAALAELDAVYGEAGEAAGAGLALQMAKDVCRAAMELNCLCALYEDPVMSQADREALYSGLCAQYGVEGSDYLRASEDVLMGSLDCAGEMLGGLYGLQLYALAQEDASAAQAVLSATLTAYNSNNPIAAGYAAGLANPYSAEGIAAIGQMLR